MHTRHRRSTAAPVVASLLLLAPLYADVIDFEADPPGTVLATVFSAEGNGPILVNGFNPHCGPDVNAAVIFDSISPTALDFDLGSPNNTCPPVGVGRGQGDGGALGAPNENCEPLGNILIVHEFCPDLVDGGPVGEPDDASFVNWELRFDFSREAPVEMISITTLDFEEPGSYIELRDRDGVVLARVNVPPSGNNGKQVIGLGPTAGVFEVFVSVQGPGAVDALQFRTLGDESQGCGQGYWKQPHHFASWSGHAPGDSFEDVFGVAASDCDTLLDGLQARGGGENALLRKAVAALLNAAHPDIDYRYTEAEVIALVQGVFADGNFEEVKDLLEEANGGECPLGRPGDGARRGGGGGGRHPRSR